MHTGHEGICGQGVRKRIMAECKVAAVEHRHDPSGGLLMNNYRDNMINKKVPASMFPNKANARRKMNAARQHLRPKPPAVGDKTFIPVVERFPPNFFRGRTMAVVNGEECCAYIFASDFQGDHVIICKTFSIDGTFSSVKLPIMQLYSIDGYMMNAKGKIDIITISYF